MNTDPTESRTLDQLREQFEIERELAERLRRADRDERKGLYTEVYDELYRRVPHHPRWTRRESEASRRAAHESQFRVLRRFLTPGCAYLEIGAGDCRFAAEVARTAGTVWAVDVAQEVSKLDDPPANFHFVLSDGTSIDVEPESIDVAYSNQMMEHLHPEDAREQLENIYRALRPGGVYVCITPNRLDGPHDVSRYFADEACGFHLKEWTYTELEALFRDVGFSRVWPLAHARSRVFRVPAAWVRGAERRLQAMPPARRRRSASRFPWRRLIGVVVVGRR